MGCDVGPAQNRTPAVYLMHMAQHIYRLTNHAKHRIRQRNLSAQSVYAALYDGLCIRRSLNAELRIDRTSRTALVVIPHRCVVKTAYRMTRKQLEMHLRRKDHRRHG